MHAHPWGHHTHVFECDGVLRIVSARTAGSRDIKDMKAQYDLSKVKSRRNPYASKLKKSVTMRLSEDVVDYFNSMATEAEEPYQSLINLYLRDCLAKNRKVKIKPD